VIQSDLVAGSSQPGHIDEIKGFTLKKIENVMRKFFSLAALGIAASAVASCSSQTTAWCSMAWPQTDKRPISGDCRFDDQQGKENNASIDFYSQDYSFVFPNANESKNYERQTSQEAVRFNHNGYILTVYPNGKPAQS
jgi:hypothetical protein|tara:strand:+ start:521 stop:934 length:414 start_codon:yes stop_codon:yes gene_type:complete